MRQISASALAVVFAGLFCCVGTLIGEQQKSDVNNILTSFPGYHLLTLKERDPNTRAYISQHFPKSNPSVVQADFDGDGHPDYALLVRNTSSKTTKLVVLLCSEDHQCRQIYELDVSAYSDLVYLLPAAIGSRVSQTEAVDSTDRSSPVKLKSTGIQVTYFEKGKVVLYWNRKLKKIQEVQTKD